MTIRDSEVSDVDLAGQAVPIAEPDEERPDAEITADRYADRAAEADVIEQHQGVPSGEDDYDR